MADWEDIVREGMGLKPITIGRLTLETEVGGGSTVQFVFGMSGNTFNSLVSARTNETIIPLMERVSSAATQLNGERSKTDRGTISVGFRDDYTDVESYGLFDILNVNYISGGSFWQILTVAYEDNLYGAKFEVISFYDDPRLTALSEGQTTFVGRVESWEFKEDLSFNMKVRDQYALKDISIPDPVDTDAVTSADMTDSQRAIPIADFRSQFTNPQGLPSVDYPPPALKIIDPVGGDEVIVYTRTSGSDNLLSAENRFAFSQQFEETSDWDTNNATITPKVIHGPWAGEGFSNGALLDITVSNGRVQQDTGLTAAGETATSSIWGREHPDDPGATIRLGVRNSTGTDTSSINFTLTDTWTRYSHTHTFGGGATGTIVGRFKSVAATTPKMYLAQSQLELQSDMAHYVRTGATGSNIAGRGVLGTTAVAHVATDVTQVLPLFPFRFVDNQSLGIHPLTIARTMLNWSAIDPADIDDVAFGSEIDFSPGDSFRRTLDESRKVKEYLAEIQRDANVWFWGNEAGKVTTRLAYRPRSPTETSFAIDEDTNILKPGPALSFGKGERVTRVFIYYDLKLRSDGSEEAGDKPQDFEEVRVRIDPEVEGFSNRARRDKFIFSKWMYRSIEAGALSARMIGRYGFGARKMRLKVAYSTRPDIAVGDLLAVSALPLVKGGSGSAIESDDGALYQVTKAQDSGDGNNIALELLQASQSRFAYINYDSASDYDSDIGVDEPTTGTPYHERAYICDSSDTVGAAGDPAYRII